MREVWCVFNWAILLDGGHQAVRSEVGIDTETSGSSNSKVNPLTADLDIHFVLSIGCWCHALEDIPKVLVGQNQGRRLTVPEETDETGKPFKLQEIHAPDAKEGGRIAVEL